MRRKTTGKRGALSRPNHETRASMRELALSVAFFGLLSVAACGERDESVEPTSTAPSAVPIATVRSKPMPAHTSAPAPKFESEQEVDAFCQQFSGLSLPPGD